MAILKSFVWIGVLVLAGILVYRFFRGNSQSIEQFQSVLNLTPDDLEARCGKPEQDLNGAIVENDGIRDLQYRDSGGALLIFRFISEDGETWQSLGAWEQVSTPDDLGDPVAAKSAARRLPCSVQSSSASSRLRLKHDGLAASLAIIWQDFPLPQANPLPGPMPVPMPTRLPPTTGGPVITTPSLLPPVGPYGRTPSVESGPGPGSGPDGPDEPEVRTPLPLPCPSESGPCEVLGYAQFIAEFHQAIEAERENNFDRAMTLLTQHGVMVVQLPSLEASRAEAVKAIVQLEVKVINIVEARLREDVAHLEPFESDSSETRAKKMAIVEHADEERRQMWKAAVAANRPSAGTSRTSSGSNYRFNSEAYQQLVQIHLTGNWP